MPHVQNGILDLIWEAGAMAKLVMLLLTVASVFSWAIIYAKWRLMKTALSENASFLEIFWHGKDVEEIFSKSEKFGNSPVAIVFQAGFKELKKLNASEKRLDDPAVDNISRALARASSSEVASLERHLGWLASTASAAPFVGLFGTVWGIMNSFQSIGATGAANLAVVAPGISEALITTATGIAAAIPAVIAYNHFSNQIRRIAVDIECFSQDFLNIVQRSMMGGKRGG